MSEHSIVVEIVPRNSVLLWKVTCSAVGISECKYQGILDCLFKAACDESWEGPIEFYRGPIAELHSGPIEIKSVQFDGEPEWEWQYTPTPEIVRITARLVAGKPLWSHEIAVGYLLDANEENFKIQMGNEVQIFETSRYEYEVINVKPLW